MAFDLLRFVLLTIFKTDNDLFANKPTCSSFPYKS